MLLSSLMHPNGAKLCECLCVNDFEGPRYEYGATPIYTTLAFVRRYHASSAYCFVCAQHFRLRGFQLAPPYQHVPPQRYQHLLFTICVERGADASRDDQLRSVSSMPCLLPNIRARKLTSLP